MIFLGIATVIAAYLLGSINFAVIITKAFSHSDIRSQGSGNAGATNVLRVSGVLPGVLTFVLDALKGFAACMLGKFVFSYIAENYTAWWTAAFAGAYFCAVACMLGHIFPVFFGFKGGKGVAICVGIFAVCCPIAVGIGLAVFAIVTLISRYVSLGSLIATAVVVVLATVFRNQNTPPAIQIVCCAIMAFLIFYKHKSNIKRLISGCENKIGR